MHLEKFQVDKIQNGRLSAIIHLNRPDIVEYHENRLRYLHHYYKIKMAAYRPLFTFTLLIFGKPC